MNLNEYVMKRGRGRGNRNILTKIKPEQNKVMDSVANGSAKKYSTSASSDLNWGKSHISVTNSSSSKKSTGSRKSKQDFASRIIVALTEGRGEARCEVGIAAIDVSMPFLILCQISDSQNYIKTLTKINIFNPSEILVPHTFVEQFSGNRLVTKVKEKFPNLKFIGVPRSTFNKIAGFEMLNNLCIPSLNGILLVLQHRYYALAASSALISYLQDHVFIYYGAGTVNVNYQESEGYAVIDVSTADNLELVSSTRPAQGNKYASLFGVLNRCQTKIGSRMLRSNILQPPFKAEYIEKRLKCVDELIENPEMLSSIQVILAKMSNIHSILSIGTMISNDAMKSSISQLNYILQLNSILDLITILKENLQGFTQPFFIQITKTLANEGFSEIKKVLRDTILDNAQPARGNEAMMQRCFIIKPGINGLLDLVRKIYTERLNDMKEYVKSLAEKYDLALTLGNNQTKGYHIVLTLSKAQRKTIKKADLPDEFIEVHSSAGSHTMKTPELVNLSTRLDDIMNDILKISNVMIHAIIVDIKKHIYLFYILCEEIAQLDVIQSLANTSLVNSYTRPNFSGFTEINSARHPILDILLMHSTTVPNNISCSDDYNVNIITGPNGSGKSIFIRQVLLLQVMAQVGCYVPAESATLKPMDRIFARIYMEDNMEFGASSFILEMKEMNYIMTSLTTNSLVIIDELGRSTALEEGTALAIAILEKLANSSAHIYITTHFTLLTRLYDMYPYVKIWQLETIPKDKNSETCQLDYKYNVLPGVTSIKHYGVTLVRDIWPNDILKYVDLLMAKISMQHDSNVVTLDGKSRLKYSVESMLRKLKLQNELTLFKLNEILNQYRAELLQLGFVINNIQQLETCRQENLSSVQNDLLANRETDPNPALDRFLDDSNCFSLSQNTACHNIEEDLKNYEDKNGAQNFFDSDVFKKPTQPQDIISLAHTKVKSMIHNSNYDVSPSQSSQQTSFIDDVDDRQSSKPFCNNSSRPSTPFILFDNICHYSPSSSPSQAGSSSMQNFDYDFEDVDIDLKHQIKEIVRAGDHFGIENPRNEKQITEKEYINRNHYEHYVSPVIVEIQEGLNNTSISWEDEPNNDLSYPECNAKSKINIISDIEIRSGRKSVELIEPQSNYNCEPNIQFYSEHEQSKNQDFETEMFQCASEKDQNSKPNAMELIKDSHFDTLSKNIVQSQMDKSIDQIYTSDQKYYAGSTSIKHETLKVNNESDKQMVYSSAHEDYQNISVNEQHVLNISNASTWKINEKSDIENVMYSPVYYQKDSTFIAKHDNMVLIANEGTNDRKSRNHNDEIIPSESIKINSDHNSTNSEKDISIQKDQTSVNSANTNSQHEDKEINPLHKGTVAEKNVSGNRNYKDIPESSTSCQLSQHNCPRNDDIRTESINENSQNVYITPKMLDEIKMKIDLFDLSSSPKNYIDKNECIQMHFAKDVTQSSVENERQCELSDSNNRSNKTGSDEISSNNGDKTSISVASKMRYLDGTPNDLPYENESTKIICEDKSSSLDKENNLETSVSYASKIRKLDKDVTYSTASADDENNQILKTSKGESSVSYSSTLQNSNDYSSDLCQYDDQITKKRSSSVTNTPNTSKKRTLDVSTSSIAAIEQTSILKNIVGSSKNSDCKQREFGMTRWHNRVTKKKFIPPRTLRMERSKKELEEQDARILGTIENSPDTTTNWEHITLPTEKQTQNMNEHVQAFPEEPKKSMTNSQPFLMKTQDLQYDSSNPEHRSCKTSEVCSENGEKTTSISIASKMRKLDADAINSSMSNDSRYEHENADIDDNRTHKSNELETSVSHASEIRKPGDDITYSSTSAGKISFVDIENNQILKTSIDKTSVSFASAVRNLDNNSSSNESDDQTTREQSSTSTTTTPKKVNLDIISGSITRTTASIEHINVSKIVEGKSNINGKRRELGMTRRQNRVSRKKFIPPRTLSAKEIRREFEEQDKKIFDSSQNYSDMTKYWKHIVNRPTVKQIQNTTHLALVRKTNEGVQVFPAEPMKKRPRRNSPMKRSFSTDNFDMSIFSDKNAKSFEEYLSSNERDYKTFRSRFDHNDGENVPSSFNPFGYSVNLVRSTKEDKFVVSNIVTPSHEKHISQLTMNSSQASSIRSSKPKKSFEPNFCFNMANFEATLQNTKVTSVTEQSNFPSLTPNGFYKQNKEHINTIINKYLPNTSISSKKNDDLDNRERRNIFDNTNLTVEDLLI